MKNCILCPDKLDSNLVILSTGLSMVLANYYSKGMINLLIAPKRHVASMIDLNTTEMTDFIEMTELAINQAMNELSVCGLAIVNCTNESSPHFCLGVIAWDENDTPESIANNQDLQPITAEKLSWIKDLFSK